MSQSLSWSSCGDIPGFVTQLVGMGGKHSAGPGSFIQSWISLGAALPFPGGQKIKGISHLRSQRAEEGISSGFSLQHSLTFVLSRAFPRAAPRGSLFLKQENADFWLDLSCLAELQVSDR